MVEFIGYRQYSVLTHKNAVKKGYVKEIVIKPCWMDIQDLAKKGESVVLLVKKHNHHKKGYWKRIVGVVVERTEERIIVALKKK
jgi:hypothetical protein